MEKKLGKKTPRDEEYVAAYLRHKSQIKAAKECGVGRETIVRAVKRAGIPLTGRTYNGQNQPQSKITDAELIEASKTMNCREIAQFYGMSEERVFRRARRLGLSIKSAGAGGHWKCRADRYGCDMFDESISLKALFNRDGGICQLCGRPTDWSDIKCGHIGRLYPTLDHIIPLSKGGAHTWDNVQLAHMACNAGKCDK